jgi:hypothetical protein
MMLRAAIRTYRKSTGRAGQSEGEVKVKEKTG